MYNVYFLLERHIALHKFNLAPALPFSCCYCYSCTVLIVLFLRSFASSLLFFYFLPFICQLNTKTTTKPKANEKRPFNIHFLLILLFNKIKNEHTQLPTWTLLPSVDGILSIVYLSGITFTINKTKQKHTQLHLYHWIPYKFRKQL